MSKRVVIIGGGVVGLCTALYTTRRGHRVTVVEREDADHEGCSFGNAGMIVPSHFTPLAAPGMVALGLKWMWNPASPFYIKPRANWDLLTWCFQFWCSANRLHVERSAPLLRDLSFASRECFEELSADCGNDFLLEKRGLLMLCRTQHMLDEEARTAENANGLGVPASVCDARQIAALDPGVAMDAAGAVYYPKDCHLSPQRFMHTLIRLCEAAGVEIINDAVVTGFATHEGVIHSANTTTDEIEGAEFVLCAGSWSEKLGAQLGLRIPIQAGKGYSVTLETPRQLPQLCSIFTEARVAVTPMGTALRFGGTMEMAGINETINSRRVQGIIDSAPRYFPEFRADDFAGIKPWCGLRPCSPDGMPYVGRTERWRNLIVATGHAMMGLSLGPVTGRIVSEIVSDEKSAFDLELLAPDRFA